MCIYVCICGGGSVYILFSAVFVIKAVSIEQAKCITIFCFFFIDRTNFAWSLCVSKKSNKNSIFNNEITGVHLYSCN